MKLLLKYSIVIILIQVNVTIVNGQKKYKDYAYVPSEVLFYDDFSYNFNGWTTGNSTNRKINFVDGVYEIESIKKDFNPFIYLNSSKEHFTLDESQDFQIEMELKLISGSETFANTLLFGQDKNGNNLRFGISGNGKFLISKRVNKQFSNFLEWTQSEVIKKGDFNKLTVRKAKGKYFFFINEALVYEMNSEPFFGQQFGVLINQLSKAHVDNFIIGYISKGQNGVTFDQYERKHLKTGAWSYQNYETDKWLLNENFDNNDNGWSVGTFNNNRSYKIDEGRYICQSLEKGVFPTSHINSNNLFTIDENRDFQIESTIKYLSGMDNNANAIIWGKADTKNRYRFGFSGKGGLTIDYQENGTWKTIKYWTNNGSYRKDAYNKLTIRKVSDYLYFFINEELFFSAKYLPLFGQKLGFQVNEQSTVFIDDLKVSYIKSRGKISDISQQPIAAKQEQQTNKTEAKEQAISTKQPKTVAKQTNSSGSTKNQVKYTYVAFSDKLPAYLTAQKAYDDRNYSESIVQSEQLIKYYPEEALLYKLAALSNMQLQNYQLAINQIDMAYILDPVNFEILSHKLIFSALLGKQNESIKYAGYLGKMVNQEWMDYLTKYMVNWQVAWRDANPEGARLIGASVTHLKAEFSKSDQSYYESVFRKIFIDCNGKYIARPTRSLQNRFNGAIQKIYDLGLPREMMHRVMYFMYNEALKQGSNNALSDDMKWSLYDFATQWLESRMWGEQEKDRVENPFLYCRFTDSKYRYFLEAGDHEKALALNSSRLEIAQKGALMKFELFNLIGDRLYVLGYLNRRPEGKSYAQALENVDKQYTSPLHVAKSYGALSNYYRAYNPPKGVAFAQKQVNYLLSTGYTSSLSLAYNDLGTAYLMNKETGKAVEAYLKSAQTNISEGGKGINYYNIAVRIAKEGLLNEAISIHLKAEESMTKHLQTLGNFSRNRFYINLYKNNTQLALLYQQAGDFKASFEAIARAKSLDLALSIDKNHQSMRLEDVQKMLLPDQLILLYSQLKYRTQDGVFMIYAISKNDIVVKVLSEVNDKLAYDGLKSVRQRYRKSLEEVEREVARNELREANFNMEANRLNAGDFNLMTEKFRKSLKSDLDIVNNEFSLAYFNAFINPVGEALAGKKDLIIIPDGALYYVPFEAIKDTKGNYLVENYDISYIQSPEILKALKERNYGNRSKTILAMGGANFDKPNAVPQLIESYNDIEKIKLKVFEDIGNKKRSMRQSWVNMGYGVMKYLPGTVKEVNSIKETIPTADIFLGNDMSETRLNKMSADGNLEQYKVLHFATHGWVENFIPELSGFTMTQFANEQNGEDGIIYLHEVENLKIKADMVMLSACQTALGKQQSGKGVSGLNKSFIKAGANSTITSLWAVNDYATSILASEMYRLVFKEGKTYYRAINEVKRNFIKGRYNQEGLKMDKISFWAPFIYYGKI